MGGPQRSGTTLLQVVLSNLLSPGFHVPEVHFIAEAVRGLKKQFSYESKAQSMFGHGVPREVLYSEVIDFLVAKISGIPDGQEFLVLKDPNFLEVWGEITSSRGPQSMLIMKRNPLDIVASYLKIGGRELLEGNINDKYARRNIRWVLPKVEKSCELVIEAEATGANVIAYEDLVEEPSAVISRIQGLLRLEPRPIDKIAWPDLGTLHSKTWRSGLVGEQISSESIQSWKTVMKPDEIKCAMDFLRPLFSPLGYEVE